MKNLLEYLLGIIGLIIIGGFGILIIYYTIFEIPQMMNNIFGIVMEILSLLLIYGIGKLINYIIKIKREK